MAEYITKEQALQIANYVDLFPIGEINECLRKEIENIPAADVAPVRHGKWIDSPDGTTTICSYCKADWNVFDNDTYRFNYCPNCGAKMDLED